MIDLNLIEKYISETFLNSNDNSKYKRETFNIINQFFNSTDVAYNDLTRNDMLDIYANLAIMKMKVFYSHKSKISDFMKWMFETGNGSVNPLNKIQDIYFGDVDRTKFYDTYYFGSIDDLLDVMETAFSERTSDFSTFRCAAILVWYGISVKQLPELLKSDVKDDGRIIHPLTKNWLILDAKVIPYLINYRDADSFYSGKFGGKTIPYIQTQYLFRSYKNAHMTDKQLINTSSNANKAAAEQEKIFQWERIYDSGLYCRVHDDEIRNGTLNRNDYERMRKLFQMEHIDIATRQKYVLLQKFDEYLEFKQYKFAE